ncbi:HIT family protein [Evansella halocellulosilytica]|uniref:HIT family protein n=1 Tax=Evansella halocellulosilytica TaxID=2011013 RepID=UPI000BB68DBC|nr:HIT family protein [Evansella halocellulosilytica]
MDHCLFCYYDQFPGQKVVFENKYVLFLQKPQEVLIGSGLIIPRAHRETVFDLTQEEWNATYVMLQQVKTYLDDENSPDGYNVGWNCKEVGGQSIPHAHLHVIPRYKDEPYAGKGLRYWLKSSENKRG